MSSSMTLIIGNSEAEVQEVFELVLQPTFDISAYSGLQIHLNASKFDAWTDDRLAVILNCFHPPAAGAQSPHSLEWLAIVNHGGVLFTRHDYSVISPTVSYDVTNKLHKLTTNDLTASEKRHLPYKVFSNEKALAKALLGIRDVPAVRFECAGEGIIEHHFLKEIERTITLSSVSGPAVPQASHAVKTNKRGGKSLYDAGVFESRGYKRKREAPYPLRSFDVKRRQLSTGKNAKLVDMITMMDGALTSKDVLIDAIREAKKKNTPRKIMAWDSGRGCLQKGVEKPTTRQSGRKKRTVVGGQGRRAMVQGDRVLTDMVRIMAQSQDGEDFGMEKSFLAVFGFDQRAQGAKVRGGEWLVLTGKGASAQLGWKLK